MVAGDDEAGDARVGEALQAVAEDELATQRAVGVLEGVAGDEQEVGLLLERRDR